VKVAVFTVGADYGFTRTEKSTGETEITFVDLGELGLEAGVGAKFKVNDAGADVSADIKAQLGLSNGDTWVFDSPGEADEFEGCTPSPLPRGRFTRGTSWPRGPTASRSSFGSRGARKTSTRTRLSRYSTRSASRDDRDTPERGDWDSARGAVPEHVKVKM